MLFLNQSFQLHWIAFDCFFQLFTPNESSVHMPESDTFLVHQANLCNIKSSQIAI